jgi:multicomponent K+:H+ antiporter subunit G
MLYFTVLESRLVIHELLISVFVLMTAPVVSMLIMRAGVYRELRERAEAFANGSEHPSTVVDPKE